MLFVCIASQIFVKFLLCIITRNLQKSLLWILKITHIFDVAKLHPYVYFYPAIFCVHFYFLPLLFLFILFFFFIIRMHNIVIAPEVVREVEARMYRNYRPTMLPPRKHPRHTGKPHLPTVQEQQGRYFCFQTTYNILCLLY